MKNEFQDNYFVKDTLRESSKDDNAPCKQRESKSQSFEMFKNRVREQAKVEENIDKVLWGLNSLVGKLFKKVYTVDKEVFVNQIKPLIWREN